MIEKFRMWLSAVTSRVHKPAEPLWLGKAGDFSLPSG